MNFISYIYSEYLSENFKLQQLPTGPNKSDKKFIEIQFSVEKFIKTFHCDHDANSLVCIVFNNYTVANPCYNDYFMICLFTIDGKGHQLSYVYHPNSLEFELVSFEAVSQSCDDNLSVEWGLVSSIFINSHWVIRGCDSSNPDNGVEICIPINDFAVTPCNDKDYLDYYFINLSKLYSAQIVFSGYLVGNLDYGFPFSNDEIEYEFSTYYSKVYLKLRKD